MELSILKNMDVVTPEELTKERQSINHQLNVDYGKGGYTIDTDNVHDILDFSPPNPPRP